MLWTASRCVSVDDERLSPRFLASVDLCKCWTSSVSLQISGSLCAEVRPSLTYAAAAARPSGGTGVSAGSTQSATATNH